VREKLVDAYLHPEKYEAERNAVSLIKDICGKDPKTLTEEEKELQKLAEKALKGDEKAMEKIKEILEERASQVSENLRSNIELLNKDPNSLSEEEREEKNRNILSYMLMSYSKIGGSDREIFDRLLNPKKAEEEGKPPVTKEEIDNLCEKYRLTALGYYQNRQTMYNERIPIILKNLDNKTLFLYLSI